MNSEDIDRRQSRSQRDASLEPGQVERNYYGNERDASKSAGVKSIEGWVIFVTNVHEEANEEDMIDAFSEFGEVKGIQMNLDRRTGFVKGYAAIEYKNKSEADEAISQMDGASILGQKINVDYAFVASRSRSRKFVSSRSGRKH